MGDVPRTLSHSAGLQRLLLSATHRTVGSRAVLGRESRQHVSPPQQLLSQVRDETHCLSLSRVRRPTKMRLEGAGERAAEWRS